MTAARLWLQLLAVTALIALGGCGAGSSGDTAEGGMGGSGGGSGGDQYAEGGMGGSGSGTSSGYGSIIVNDTRHFPIDPNADVFVDGGRVAPDEINDVDRGVPLGMTLEYVLSGDANDDLTEGTAIGIRANHRAIGPVTGKDPLEVLGQKVLVTSETRGPGESESENLATGDVVKVDGHVNGDGTIRATRLVEATVSDWQLMGRVDSGSVESGSFEIGGQKVILNGASIEQCGTALDEGERVLVRATEPGSFDAGDPLDTVYQVRCPAESLSLFNELDKAPDAPAELPASYEGIVTEILSDLSGGLPTSLQALRDAGDPLMLSLNGQKVAVPLDNLPELLSGTLGDLAQNLGIGVKIEVEGSLNTETGIITAEKIRFRDPIVSLTGDLVDLENALGLLGRTLNSTPELLDSGNLLTDFLVGNRVTVRGFVTENNTVYAGSIESADASPVSLRGPVTLMDTDTNSFELIGTAYATETGEITLIEGSSLLEPVEELTEIVLQTSCNLLLLCPEQDQEFSETDLEHAVGDATGMTWTGEELKDGTLELHGTDH